MTSPSWEAATPRCAPRSPRPSAARASSSSSAPPACSAAATAGTRSQPAVHAHRPNRRPHRRYAEDEFMADLLRVTGGATNETLARMVDSRIGRRAARG